MYIIGCTELEDVDYSVDCFPIRTLGGENRMAEDERVEHLDRLSKAYVFLMRKYGLGPPRRRLGWGVREH